MKPLKTTALRVRINDEERVLVDVFAKAHGMKLSAFVRQAALSCAEISPFVDDEDAFVLGELQDDLRKVGVNLNQIARAINSGRHPSADEIGIVVNSTKEITLAVDLRLKEMLKKTSRFKMSGDPVAVGDRGETVDG